MARDPYIGKGLTWDQFERLARDPKQRGRSCEAARTITVRGTVAEVYEELTRAEAYPTAADEARGVEEGPLSIGVGGLR